MTRRADSLLFIYSAHVDTDTLLRRKREIVARYGPWTAHPIELAGGIYTIDEDVANRAVTHGRHLKRILQVASDLAARPLASLRVLDLACLEGMYGIEFARHGAEVVAIDVREEHLAKTRFAAEVLQLARLTAIQDDVRNLSVEKYGRFDVVLCLGIFYHLDAPDLFRFAEAIRAVCSRVAIFDTHVAVWPRTTFRDGDARYHGKHVFEHFPWSSPEARRGKLWASIDNPRSVWLTRPSLFNLLTNAGFTSVYSCHVPAFPGRARDRDTFAALIGEPETTFSTPPAESAPRSLVEEDTAIARARNFLRDKVRSVVGSRISRRK